MKKNIRVLWLLNHTTLRQFEIKQLQAMGIHEIYLPKHFPYDEGNLSASIDTTLDADLTIPPEALKILNEQNWYDTPSQEAWRIANQYFDIAFIAFFQKQVTSCVKNFLGAIVLRIFGLAQGYSYTQMLSTILDPSFINKLRCLGNRFWFGIGYEHLKDVEGYLFKKRNCFLPVGLESDLNFTAWRGNDKRIFFVCPRIGSYPYFKTVYETFKKNFSDFGYVIGGAQPIQVQDPHVLGFVSREVHARNMQEMRVMFYHSTEPNHIHYHPFEAIQAGMPLVFMAGGILERFGKGKKLPGCCKSIKEAHRKIARILNDDWKFIEDIRHSQLSLLEPMKPENCAKAWRVGFQCILNEIDEINLKRSINIAKKIRVAIIIAMDYQKDSFREATLLSKAITIGSREAAEEVEVILGYLDEIHCYSEEILADLPASIKRRSYKWRRLAYEEANRAMIYAGLEPFNTELTYIVPDDGIKQFMDCDLWIVVANYLSYPLLPVCPYILIGSEYLQHDNRVPQINQAFINTAHSAQRVFVTTEFARQFILQFAGLLNHHVVKLPMVIPNLPLKQLKVEDQAVAQPYFLWITTLALHENHENVFKALQLYYTKYTGQLRCHVAGVSIKSMIESDLPYLKFLRDIYSTNSVLKRNIKILGELPEYTYQVQLAGSQFLWHAAKVDNGTFNVVEAASLGVPALSSDYPPMREIEIQFGLKLAWMDPYDPDNMAKQLKAMEKEANVLRTSLPSVKDLARQSAEQLASTYWNAVRECL